MCVRDLSRRGGFGDGFSFGMQSDIMRREKMIGGTFASHCLETCPCSSRLPNAKYHAMSMFLKMAECRSGIVPLAFCRSVTFFQPVGPVLPLKVVAAAKGLSMLLPSADRSAEKDAPTKIREFLGF